LLARISSIVFPQSICIAVASRPKERWWRLDPIILFSADESTVERRRQVGPKLDLRETKKTIRLNRF
jgi:hypothetical protein